MTTDGVTVTAAAYDDYGNAATTGSLVFVNATDKNGNVLDGITAQPTEAQLTNGSAQISVTSDKTQEAVLNFETKGSYPEDTKTFSMNVYFVKPVPTGSQISVSAEKNSDGSFAINGSVKLDGNPVANVGVPLKASNGTLSDDLPVTDDNGNFTVTLTKENTSAVVLSLDNSKVSDVYMPTLGIDPTIFGNQAWTDTGIDITSPNTLVRVQSTGTWADSLYAKVGDNGIPVKIGANGGFVTGVTGRLCLGPNNTTYPDNVDSTIYLDDPKSISIYPTMSITANPTEIYADGKSTSAISGQVLYGQYPLVGGSVTLSTTSGTLDKTVANTDGTGKYTATFTAGTTAGTAVVSGQFDNLNQSVAISLKDNNVLANLSKISAGFNWTLAVKNDGTVWGWGANYSGQLGDGTLLNRLIPVQAINMNDAVQVAANSIRSFILKKDGTVWYLRYWKPTADSAPSTMAQVQGLTNIKKIATSSGSIHLLALKDDGTVWAYGNNQFGQLGDGTTISPSTPVQVKNLTNVKDIVASQSASFALKDDGTVWGWGNPQGGLFGYIPPYDPVNCGNITVPQLLRIFTNVKQIVANGYYAAVLKNDGTVWYTGNMTYRTYSNTEIRQIKGLTNIVSIAAGYDFIVALKDDGTVWTWGNNTYGQLGNGTTSNGLYEGTIGNTTVESAVQVKNLTNVVQVAAGNGYALAVKSDGSIWAWGFNGYGQLGNGTTINSPVPVQVQNLNLLN